MQNLFSTLHKDIENSMKRMENKVKQLSLEEFGKKKQYVFPEYFHGTVLIVPHKSKAQAA